MKKKIAVLITAAIIGASFTACQGSSTAQTSKSTSTQVKSENITATPEAAKAAEELITIGTQSENSYEVKLTNKTGKDIKGLYVKTTSQTEFADNLIAENVIWENDKKADIFYAEKKAEDDTASVDTAGEVESASSSKEFALEDGYDIKLVFSDDTEYVLHAFPCDDIEEGEVYIESTENVAYLKYTSISTKEAVETKEAEIATKQNNEAAAAAAAAAQEAQTAADAQAQAEAQAAADAQAAQEAQAAADAQAQAEAQAAAEAQARAQAQAEAQAAADAQARAQAQAEAEAAQQQQTQTNNNANGCGDDFAFN